MIEKTPQVIRNDRDSRDSHTQPKHLKLAPRPVCKLVAGRFIQHATTAAHGQSGGIVGILAAMCFFIPSGTRCSIARDDDARRWKPHTTTRDLTFADFRTNNSGAFTFEQDGWLLLIRCDAVTESPEDR